MLVWWFFPYPKLSRPTVGDKSKEGRLGGIVKIAVRKRRALRFVFYKTQEKDFADMREWKSFWFLTSPSSLPPILAFAFGPLHDFSM